jgi:hypothetical protein
MTLAAGISPRFPAASFREPAVEERLDPSFVLRRLGRPDYHPWRGFDETVLRSTLVALAISGSNGADYYQRGFAA